MAVAVAISDRFLRLRHPRCHNRLYDYAPRKLSRTIVGLVGESVTTSLSGEKVDCDHTCKIDQGGKN